jgi:hypothetical protein
MTTLKMAFKPSSAHTLRSVRAMATRASFSEVKMGLTDPMQTLKRDYDLDSTPSKVDLGAGVLRDERGRTYEFPVIQKVRLDVADGDWRQLITVGETKITRATS